MTFKGLYNFSASYGPPDRDIRTGFLYRNYMDHHKAPLKIRHEIPRDVTRESLETYTDGYSHMPMNSILFYLWPEVKYHMGESDYVGLKKYLIGLLHHITKMPEDMPYLTVVINALKAAHDHRPIIWDLNIYPAFEGTKLKTIEQVFNLLNDKA